MLSILTVGGTNQQICNDIPRAMPPMLLTIKELLDKVTAAAQGAVSMFSVFKAFYLTPVASKHITLKRRVLALQLLQEIQREIKLSTKAVRDYVLSLQHCSRYIQGPTF